MSLSSQLGLEDVGALLSGPSFLTADPLGPLLDEDEEPLGGIASPLSFSSADSPSSLPSLSPPSSPLLGCKAGVELLPLPWLSATEMLDSSISPDSGKDDAFSGMDWMAEDLDLSEFDLDSLMGSCDSDEPPSSPEELIASLESHMDLELDPLQFNTTVGPQEELPIPVPELPPCPPPLSPEPQQELEIKSEPASPVPSPSPLPPLSPAFTLELGSEVDVPENEKITPGIVLSLSPAHIVLLLAPKEELSAVPMTLPASSDDHSDSDSGIGSVSGSPPHSSCSTPPPTGSPRAKPYSTLSKSKPAPEASVTPGKVKCVSGAPKVVEKKLKKMEQNKTAATRYRQKKRVEQETLNTECTRLEQRNRELVEKADSISKEIQYLKDLIEEVRTAKSRKKLRQEQP